MISFLLMFILLSTTYGMISEEAEIGEFGCECIEIEETNYYDYDINNDGSTNVIDVVHLVDEIIN